MTLNQVADAKLSMIMTIASLIITITLTQYDRLHLSTRLLLVSTGLAAVIFSIFARRLSDYAGRSENLAG